MRRRARTDLLLRWDQAAKAAAPAAVLRRRLAIGQGGYRITGQQGARTVVDKEVDRSFADQLSRTSQAGSNCLQAMSIGVRVGRHRYGRGGLHDQLGGASGLLADEAKQATIHHLKYNPTL